MFSFSASQEVREIKRKMIIVTLLALSLAMVVAVAALAPTVVVARHKHKDESLTSYAYGGQVTVQLPEGVPPHPTTLLIAAQHIERRGDYPMRGPHDLFAVFIWVPSMNSFMPAIAIGDNQNPEHQDLIKEVYNGTPLWNPALGMENLVWVDKKELVTRKRGDVFLANLTVGMHVSLNFTNSPLPPMQALGDLSFDLPPIALEVRGIDSPYSGDSVGTFPSGWSSSSSYVRKPAWVRLWIQEWTGGGSAFKFAGELGVHARTTLTPPTA
jgi:hypothetical protein